MHCLYTLRPMAPGIPCRIRLLPYLVILCFSLGLDPVAAEPPTDRPTGDQPAGVRVQRALQQWHKITVTLDGPSCQETDTSPNPFLDYRLIILFQHASGTPRYEVPGYFAADGKAAHTSARGGNQWRAHLSPDKPGRWDYEIQFVQGSQIAVYPERTGQPLGPWHGQRGSFVVQPSDKTGRDFRAHGRLRYVGRRYLQFAGSGEYFLKAGADAPETLLAYEEFDGTKTLNSPLKTWQPHYDDWRPGDPTWQQDKGKGLIGALNYLASKGANAFSFLSYNVGGDGQNVWPFVQPDDKLHYDCSKLDQWQIVFDHAQTQGLFLHFKLQEQENDDNRQGHRQEQSGAVPAALDGGELGVERRLYCRELIARFGHALALNWNLGEENTQSAEQQRAMARFIRQIDPYDHLIVVHTFPDRQDRVYPPLLGDGSMLEGASLQNSWAQAHQRTLHWIEASEQAGKPWVVANDEQNPADMGVPPDPGYQGFEGQAVQNGQPYDLHDIRKYTLWGTLLAGGAGVEYYFGYRLPENDLVCQDWRSRDRSWDYCRIALEFFRQHQIPFWQMQNADARVGNREHDNSRYCFALPEELYLVYLPEGGSADLDLSDGSGRFDVAWFDPRQGGPLQAGSVSQVTAGDVVSLGTPPSAADQDWLVAVRRAR